MLKITAVLTSILVLAACNRETSKMENDNSKISKRNKAAVVRFFQQLEKENIPEFVEMFAEEGRQVNPYASGLFPSGAAGKKALLAYWKPVPGLFDGMKFEINEIYALESPDKVYVKYSGKINLKGGTGIYQNDYYSIFTFDNQGKILEYVEIFNPITAARAFGMLDKIR